MIKLGIEHILDVQNLFESKRVGLITNQTGVDQNLKSSIEVISEVANLTVLFAPEHGLDGVLQAGVKVSDQESNNRIIYSLYGKNRKPNEDMLKDVDIICYDIQDIGARFYTYISTLYEAMQAAKMYHKEVVVFDRPNPVGGCDVEGHFLAEGFTSFVGINNIVHRYGLTIGELALLFNDHFKINCKLHIIKMSNYKRAMDYTQTNRLWILPSPNIPTTETPYVYLATCYFEGTNVSEGRGTTKPFSMIGAPWIDSNVLIQKLKELNLEGVLFRAITFTPTFSKHQNILCHGIELHITNRTTFKPVFTGYALIKTIQQLHVEFKFLEPYTEFGKPMIDLLTGNDDMRNNKVSLDQIAKKIDQDTKAFKLIKERYHLYD